MGHVHANIGLMQQFANASWEIICPETWNSIFDHMTHVCISEHPTRHFFCSEIKFIVICCKWTYWTDFSLEEHTCMGFSKAIVLTKSWTYCEISLVTLNQVSQFVQKSPPVGWIHCSPRTAQFEGLLGCFYSNINICLDIRFKATSNKFEFKNLACKLLKFTAPSVSARGLPGQTTS